MPLARVGNVLLYFAHVPKTGGSSIESYLAARGQVCLVSKRRTDFSRVTPQHMERETFGHYIPRQFYDHGFAIIREPLARLESEFRHQVRLNKARIRLPNMLRFASSGRRAEVAGKRAEIFVERGDFDGWAQAVLTACKADPYVCDNHIRPQFDFVHPEHRLFDLGAGLAPVIDWIDWVAGLTPWTGPVPYEKRSPRTPLKLSPRTRSRIERFYKKDTALLRNLRRCVQDSEVRTPAMQGAQN